MPKKAINIIVMLTLYCIGALIHKYLISRLSPKTRKVITVIGTVVLIGFALETVYVLFAP